MKKAIKILTEATAKDILKDWKFHVALYVYAITSTILIVLKLNGITSLSWLWILSPTWIGLCLLIGILVIGLIIMAILFRYT